MITLTREEAQQVLDAFENWDARGRLRLIETLRARLSAPKHWSDCAVHSEPAYPAGECNCGLVPIAWADKHDIEREGHDFYVSRQQPAKDGVPLYTAPPQREWVGLTDEEKNEITWGKTVYEILDLADAKLREKNGGR